MAPNAVPGVPILFRTVPCSERVPNMFRTCSAPQSKKKEKQKKKDNKEKKLLPPIILFSSLPSVWSFLLGLFLRLLPRRLCLRLLLRRPPLIHSPSFVPPIPSPSLCVARFLVLFISPYSASSRIPAEFSVPHTCQSCTLLYGCLGHRSARRHRSASLFKLKRPPK